MRLILGDTGNLGKAFAKLGDCHGVSLSDCQTYPHTKLDLLTEKEWFKSLVEDMKPEVIINCVGLTDIKLCEERPDLARELNTELPKWLATLGTPLIHFSTDQVFDGTGQRPYKERDIPNPVNFYGVTKEAGERGDLVIRTNLVGFRDKPSRPTFIEWLIDSLERKLDITLFYDFVTSPIHVDDLARLTMKAFEKGLIGLYHISTWDYCSKYLFARWFAEETGLPFNVKRGSVAELSPLRPRFIPLNCNQAEKEIGPMPSVMETVKKLAKEYKEKRCS